VERARVGFVYYDDDEECVLARVHVLAHARVCESACVRERMCSCMCACMRACASHSVSVATSNPSLIADIELIGFANC
jgi:hypothetical protein